MENKSKLDNIIQDAKQVITNPAVFYREMPKAGGYPDPLIFVVVMALIAGILIAVLSLFGAGMIGGMTAGLGAIIILPIVALIGSFIGAAILFVIWRLVGSSESYETAYRCVAYAAAIYPISVVVGLIPYLGTVIGLVWGFYLMVMASIEVHKINAKTAYIVFGVLGGIMLVINLGSEMAARSMASKFEGMGAGLESMNEKIERGEMSPEDAGKAFGEFLKGMEKAGKDAQQEQK